MKRKNISLNYSLRFRAESVSPLIVSSIPGDIRGCNPKQGFSRSWTCNTKDGTWFTYGYDITKNVCEVFGPHGYIRTAYSYAPYGAVSASGDVAQPFRWSAEHYDTELGLVYYNYRHYSPSLGRFLSRDPIEEQGGRNLYAFVKNSPTTRIDSKGKNFCSFLGYVKSEALEELDAPDFHSQKEDILNSNDSEGIIVLCALWAYIIPGQERA